MRHIAIIGAGQAGLVLAHSLVRAGYEVDVYSDRTADQWLNESRPTGTALLNNRTIGIEKDLGIDQWADVMLECNGVLLHMQAPGSDLLVVQGRTQGPGGAVDQRLKFYHWMNELEVRGGRVIIESVTPERLDEISAGVDLTILAAGKAELGRLIPRDEERSVYHKPLRRLAMGIVRNVKGWVEELGYTPVKFNFVPGVGEFFWVPYYHKTAGQTWAGIFEAVPEGPMDIFGNCKSGEDVVECFRKIVKEFAPWDLPMVGDMEYVSEDPYGWLTGQFPPGVRAAFGLLPSGRAVMPVGDTAITFDPIGGQGANTATRNAVFTAQKIIERGDLPFDQEWMTALNTEFWNSDAKFAYNFNNSLLEPPTEAMQQLLVASAQNQKIAEDVMIAGIVSPKDLVPHLENEDSIRKLISETV